MELWCATLTPCWEWWVISLAPESTTGGQPRDCLGWGEVPYPRSQLCPRPVHIQWLISLQWLIWGIKLSSLSIPNPEQLWMAIPALVLLMRSFLRLPCSPALPSAPTSFLCFLFLSFPRCQSQQYPLMNLSSSQSLLPVFWSVWSSLHPHLQYMKILIVPYPHRTWYCQFFKF